MDLRFLYTSPRFHVGVEVSCISQWEIDEIASGRPEDPVYGIRQRGPADGAPAIGLTATDIERVGMECLIGGAHWPLYCRIEREAVIRNYHRQNMFLAVPFGNDCRSSVVVDRSMAGF